jgi:hypothetical protein
MKIATVLCLALGCAGCGRVAQSAAPAPQPQPAAPAAPDKLTVGIAGDGSAAGNELAAVLARLLQANTEGGEFVHLAPSTAQVAAVFTAHTGGAHAGRAQAMALRQDLRMLVVLEVNELNAVGPRMKVTARLQWLRPEDLSGVALLQQLDDGVAESAKTTQPRRTRSRIEVLDIDGRSTDLELQLTRHLVAQGVDAADARWRAVRLLRTRAGLAEAAGHLLAARLAPGFRVAAGNR